MNQPVQKHPSALTFLDGACGTQMQKRGMPANVCPELWAIENPHALSSIYQAYIDAGAQNLLTFTFGANRHKLAEYGLADRADELNIALARIAKNAIGPDQRIGGDIGPLGSLLEPLGDIPFEEAVDIFRQQAAALAEGGAAYISIETMLDIQEARAAVIGAREACDLPIFATLTFENGRTLTGTTPSAAIVTLQSLGVCAIGSNCGSGPVQMLPVIQEMSQYATVSLIAKPNAGLPKLVDGETIYDMSPSDFALQAEQLALSGARFIGGCCGSTPDHIRALHDRLKDLRFISPPTDARNMLSSARACKEFTDAVMMGNINLASHPEWIHDILDEDYDDILEMIDEIDSAQLLCICTKLNNQPPDEEVSMLIGITQALSNYTPLPLAFRPSSRQAAEAALRIYPGRALILLDQAINESERLAITRCANHYGALILH